MWLLPIVFMIHDFEEIIMMKPWAARNAGMLQKRFPGLAKGILAHLQQQSTSSFALAVAEEFILLSALTLWTVERGLYSVWAGILIAYFAHLLIHMAQFAAFRQYVPVIITSLLTSIYCIWALVEMNLRGLIVWQEAWLWAGIGIVVVVVNVITALWAARRFEQWLNQWRAA